MTMMTDVIPKQEQPTNVLATVAPFTNLNSSTLRTSISTSIQHRRSTIGLPTATASTSAISNSNVGRIAQEPSDMESFSREIAQKLSGLPDKLQRETKLDIQIILLHAAKKALNSTE